MASSQTDEQSVALYLMIPAENAARQDDLNVGQGEEQHNRFGGRPTSGEVVLVTDAGVPAQWRKVIQGAAKAVSAAIEHSPLGFELSEVELSFGVGTDGLLGLLVGVKADGAVKLKFTPPNATKGAAAGV